jgi:hypothetical protein
MAGDEDRSFSEERSHTLIVIVGKILYDAITMRHLVSNLPIKSLRSSFTVA